MEQRKELQEKDYRHNEKMMIVDGIGWASGYELFNAGSIVSVFIYSITGSVTLAGLANSLQSGGMLLGQLIVGPKVSNIQDGTQSIVGYTIVSRILLLIAALTILLPIPPIAIAYTFLSLFFISWVAQGGVALIWMDMFPRVIQQTSFGKVIGGRGTLGYIGAFISGLLAKFILSGDKLTLNYKYSIIIGFGILFSSLCVFALRSLRDSGPKNRIQSHSIKDMIKDLPGKIRLPQCVHFRKYLIVRLTAFFSDAMLPFMLVFAASNGNLSVSQTATLVFIKILGSLSAAYLGGKVIDKYGGQVVITFNFILRLVLTVICIYLVLVPDAGWGFYIVMVIFTGIGMQGMLSYTAYNMVVTPDEIRPDMLLVNAIMGLPFSVLALVLGGLADSVGFLPLFISMGVFTAIGVVLSRKLLISKEEQQAFLDGK